MNTIKINRVFTLCLFFVLVLFRGAYGQSFGLGFYGYEVHQEKRTGLDLSPGKTLCFSDNFDLSFDVAFRPNQKTYFGYIVRIIEDNRTNIDIIHNDLSKDHKHFKLVIGDTYSKLAFEIPKDKLFTQWNNIRLRFDYDKSRLTLYSGSSSVSQSISLHRNSCYKILFGANSYYTFETTDVPPMKVRDVQISQENKLKYHWELNEHTGTTAYEDVREENAGVTNPLWIKEKHYNWEQQQSVLFNGEAAAAFDQQNEKLYLSGNDSVLSYSIPDKALTVFNCHAQQYLMRGTQAIYVPYTGSFFDINVDSKQAARFDIVHKKWSQKLSDSLVSTCYWHFNKFFSPVDSSLYVIGGYGLLNYKNSVQRYHIPTKQWQIIKPGGAFIPPHYLAALGATQSGAYILGGYGSLTGEQNLNPRYFYSLIYFDAKTKTFKKIYDLKVPAQDFALANSMVINEGDSTYYALLFDKNKYESKLQLITGSLNRPGFRKVGNAIPYTFQDVSSFADLFYSAKSGRFIAVTFNRNENNKTRATIYSIYSPPVAIDLQAGAAPGRFHFNMLYLIGFLLCCAIGVFAYKRMRLTKKTAAIKPGAINDHEKESIEPVIRVKPPVKEEPVKFKNAIFLFGGLQVFDAEGNELTKSFTPLIKELFLIILLYSIRWGRGISSEKLEELLWFDKSINNAHNNRYVNIARLRTILEKLVGCTISKESGYWKINMDEQLVMVDYKSYLDIINAREDINKQGIEDFTKIIRRGGFLSGVEFEWLDVFKAEITNEVVNIYLDFANSIKIADDPEFLVQLANYVFNFDPVNEEAMVIKCKTLSHLGKHSLAKSAFENFAREYKSIYDENFKKDFHTVLNNN